MVTVKPREAPEAKGQTHSRRPVPPFLPADVGIRLDSFQNPERDGPKEPAHLWDEGSLKGWEEEDGSRRY